MRKNSLWYKSEKCLNTLNNDLIVDVLIIGGGITGLSTAYNLKNSKLKVALLERLQIGSGVTSGSTAKITFLQETIYSKLKLYHGFKKSKEYLTSQIEAIKIIVNTIKKNKINCDLEKSESYLFATNEQEIEKVKKEEKILNTFGIKTKSSYKLPDEKCNYAFSVNNTYVFHPIKYINSLKNICLKNNVNIYENTKIENIKKENNYYICKSSKYVIKAKYIVLALHYPYFLFPYLMPLKTSLEKSYIGAYKVKKNYNYNAINAGKPIKSIRFYSNGNKHYKILLKGSHNISIKNNEKDNFNNLKKEIKKNSEFMWSNIDLITYDSLPFIGSINQNLFIGTGYNTWGMTNATLAGKIISDLILKNKNQYSKLFNPKRCINLGKIINFPLILSSNMYSFINSKININKKWYKYNINFKNINNKKVATYIDENNEKHMVYPTCPHMKCNLIFNEIECTWDCPCHGSRFDKDGKCIEGPSNYDISYKN